MRTADAKKVLRSYTTDWNNATKRWEVKETTWLPGYTSAHKATPEEAMQFRIDILDLEKKKLDGQIARLQSDKFDIPKENN